MAVINVTPGVVRNLLKTTYYLRVPRQESDNYLRMDRQGQVIPLFPNVNTEIFWKDFDVLETQLERLEREKVIKIVQRPQHASTAGDVGVQEDNVVILDPVRYVNFHGNVTVVDEGGGVAGVTIGAITAAAKQVEVAFFVADWVNHQIDVIPAGVPGAGQIGPHTLPVLGKEYVVSVYKTVGVNLRKPVGLDILVNIATGVVSLRKAPLAAAFDGVVTLSVGT
jgi:hypothetical protein